MKVKARPHPSRFGQNAAEIAAHLVRRVEMDAAILAERLIKIDVGVRAHRFDLKFEEFAQRFCSLEAHQAQFILAERRREPAGAPVLRGIVGHEDLPS